MNPTPRYCGECGAPIEQGARFCGECGSVIAELQDSDPKAAPGKARSGPSPHPAESGRSPDTSAEKSPKKGISWPRSTWSRALWVCGLLFAAFGGQWGLLLLLVFILFFAVKLIVDKVRKK